MDRREDIIAAIDKGDFETLCRHCKEYEHPNFSLLDYGENLSPIRHLLRKSGSHSSKHQMFVVLLGTMSEELLAGDYGLDLVREVIRFGSLEMLRLVLEKGVNMKSGPDPLITLAKKPKFSPKKADLLMRYGCDIEGVEGSNLGCLSIAVRRGNIDFLSHFSDYIREKNKSHLLFDACWVTNPGSRAIPVLKFLLHKCNLDPDTPDPDGSGNRLLHYVPSSRLDLAQILVDAGADVGVKNNEGLHTWETGRERDEAQRFLKQEYAKAQERSDMGMVDLNYM